MKEHEDQEQRIVGILGGDNLAVSLKSLALYRDHLGRSLDMPCTMTGIEGFPWEENYDPGLGAGLEYDATKEPLPACSDTYELKRFEEPFDETTGILVKVKRLTDNRRFVLRLASLRAVDPSSKNHTLLDDYSSWFINH